MKQKTLFIVFEGLSFGKKNKKLVKNSCFNTIYLLKVTKFLVKIFHFEFVVMTKKIF